MVVMFHETFIANIGIQEIMPTGERLSYFVV